MHYARITISSLTAAVVTVMYSRRIAYI